MDICNRNNCEHFLALSIIQSENLDLKKEILILKLRNTSAANEESYQHRLEIDKENQELTSKLSISKQMIVELQPKLTEVLQSIQNIEQTLHWEKSKQKRYTSPIPSRYSHGNENVTTTGTSSVPEDENSFVEAPEFDINESGEKAVENKLETLEPKIEKISMYNEDTSTDNDNSLTGTSSVLPVETPSELNSQLNTNSTEIVPFALNPLFPLQNFPDDKSVLSECSVCHKTFQNFSRLETTSFQGSPCCEKCKLPQPICSSSRGITFQYPKISSIPGASNEIGFPHEVNNFAQTDEFSMQYMSHVNEKQYQCQVCGKTFTRSHGLKKHIRIHTGEKPYVCKICGKSFAVSGGLTLHIRIHTGEKPFECKLCGKRFTESSKLKIHYRKHTGEKPFTCEVCDKGFSQMSTLTIHCRRHLSETRNKCGKCGNGFRNPNSLRMHRCLQICDSTLEVQNNSETVLGDDRLL